MDKELLAVANMLAAVVVGADEEFVRVPYGASHEDVAAINEWHQMAREAIAALSDYKRHAQSLQMRASVQSITRNLEFK